ncbi:iron-regulated protein, partial [filamentous cyanobacterium CCP5]
MPHFRRYLALFLLGSTLLTTTSAACADNASAPGDRPAAPVIVEAQNLGNQPEAIAPLLGAEVIYLGEQHDSQADHDAQLAIIAALYAENSDLAIALEMFQRPFQPVIDRYLAGEISEVELVEQTEYEQRWGFPWEYYAPVLRFAKAHQLPVLALNAPSEITRQVAREGLDSLEANDFRYIPLAADIDTSNADYRAFVQEAFGAHGSHGDFNFDHFFAAQVVWDETMAAAIADFKTKSPDTTVIVLAGSGHVIYGYGIPSRVDRRLGPELNQTTVLLNFPTELLAEGEDIA